MELVKTIEIGCGQTYLVKTKDGHYLELGDVFMSQETAYGTRPYHYRDFDRPSDTNKRVMTICTMAGCPMGCTFCASRNSFKNKLTSEEIVAQVEFMIRQGITLGRNPDPNNAKEFRILYTRMGEPMLNAGNVITSIYQFVRRYPHVIIGMSSSGILSGVQEFLNHPAILPQIDMQFSLHSTVQAERHKLFGRTRIMTIEEIAQATKLWFRLTGKKVSLNVILFNGYSYDFKSLIPLFNKDHVWLRLSPWNVVNDSAESFQGLLQTKDVLHKKPISSESLKEVIRNIEEAGIAYSYAPAIDKEVEHNVACGQAFEAFKELVT